MRFIDKNNRLSDWDDYIKNSNPSTWENSSSKKQLKLHNRCYEQQNGLCIYCEQKIPPNCEQKPVQRDTLNALQPSHLEHILPKSIFPELQFEQNNLAMSCMGFREGKYERDKTGRVKRVEGIKYNFCGHKKDNEMNEDLFINPVCDKETHKYFIFDIEGYINPSKENSDKAKYTIELLKLNHPDLVEWRRGVYENLIEDTKNNKLNIDTHLANFPLFYSMIKYLFNK